MEEVTLREVAMRMVRTGALTLVGIAAMQPAVIDALASAGRVIRVSLPVLAVVAAVVLSVLGRRLPVPGRWPAGLVRSLLALGWLLAGAVVMRRLLTIVDVDATAVLVGLLVLPAKVLLRS